MKISPLTLQILENFATIHPNLTIEPGNKIRTMASSTAVVAEATVDETFAKPVRIYDATRFLSVISMLGGDPEFDFDDNSVTISKDRSRTTLKYAHASEMQENKVIKQIPPTAVAFDLTKDVFDRLRKAGSVLQVDRINFFSTDGKDISASVHGKDDDSKKYEEGGLGDAGGKVFSVSFKLDNMKILSGNYKVQIFEKKAARLVHASDRLSYIIAMEASSIASV